MSNDLAAVIISLNEWGLADVILPFILIFAVVYSAISKAKILGAENRHLYTLIALIMALMVVVPHITNQYPPGADVVDIINKALPQVSLLIVGIIAALIIAGIFVPKTSFEGQAVGGLFVLGGILVVAYIFLSSANIFSFSSASWLGFLNDSDTQSVIIIVLIFAGVVWFVTKGSGENKREGLQGVGNIFTQGLKELSHSKP